MIFDGKTFAKELEQKVKERVGKLDKPPKIISVLVGQDPASELYTRLKAEAAARVGIIFQVERLKEGYEKDALKQRIEELAQECDGLMIQMPIPGFDRQTQREILESIPANKDVDGLRWEESGNVPATVKAVLSILETISNNILQKKFVILGTHGNVGKPLIHFLKERGVHNITEINSDTQNVDEKIRTGEVVISCVGRPEMVKAAAVNPNAVVIDVGISKKDGKVVGDMEPEVYRKASFAVPVPGGVGPITVSSLLENAVSLRPRS